MDSLSLEPFACARWLHGARPLLGTGLTLALVLTLNAPADAQDEDFDPQELDPEKGLIAEEPPEPELAQASDDESPFDTGTDPAFDGPEETPAEEEDSGGALLLAGKLGGGLPFNDFDLNVAGAIEVGYLFSRTGTSLGVFLDVSYFVPQAEGTATDMRLSSADDGGYSWNVWQKELSFQPTLLYRLTFLSRAVVPYVGAGPRVYLLETVVEGRSGDASFPVSRESSTKVGFGLPLGAEITLGPGGVIAELLFQWGPLDHEITGDTHLASTTLWLGYRALL